MFTVDGLTAWVFPGQGVKLQDIRASAVFLNEHYRSVTQRIFEPPREYVDVLSGRWENSPVETQAAIFLISVAAGRVLSKSGNLGCRPDFVAGHSLGKYVALEAAGVLDLWSAFDLVYFRAQLMRTRREERAFGYNGMLAVIGLPLTEVQAICQRAKQPSEVLVIANYNGPEQFVLAGHRASLEAAKKVVFKKAKIKESQVVAVSLPLGPFHSELMSPAVAELAEKLTTVAFHPSRLRVIDDGSGELYEDQRFEAIAQDLSDHLVRPVRWDLVMAQMRTHQVTRVIDLGPGEMMRKIVAANLPDCQVLSLREALEAPSE